MNKSKNLSHNRKLSRKSTIKSSRKSTRKSTRKSNRKSTRKSTRKSNRKSKSLRHVKIHRNKSKYLRSLQPFQRNKNDGDFSTWFSNLFRRNNARQVQPSVINNNEPAEPNSINQNRESSHRGMDIGSEYESRIGSRIENERSLVSSDPPSSSSPNQNSLNTPR